MGLLLRSSIMTQISELTNCFKMLDGDISDYEMRFISVMCAEFNVLPRFSQIN